MFSCYVTSCNSLWDTSVKRSSNSHKQRRLLCILSQHCSWKQIPHLSPPPPITVISPICLSQWQVSWSCSLYSFSYKSLLIVSLRGCCASPALGLWQCADLEPSSQPGRGVGQDGTKQPRVKKKKKKSTTVNCNCQSRTSHSRYAHGEPRCAHLTAASLLEYQSLRSLKMMVIITISTSTTGQMTLEPGPIVLTWSSFIALLRLTRSFFTPTPCVMPGILWQSRGNMHGDLASVRKKMGIYISLVTE